MKSILTDLSLAVDNLIETPPLQLVISVAERVDALCSHYGVTPSNPMPQNADRLQGEGHLRLACDFLVTRVKDSMSSATGSFIQVCV